MLQTTNCVFITLQKFNVFYACLGLKPLAHCLSLFCSLLVAFYFLPVARYYLLVARYFLIVAGCFPLVACYFFIIDCYYLLVTRYFLLVTLLVTFWSSLSPSASRLLLFQRVACYSFFFFFCSLPVTSLRYIFCCVFIYVLRTLCY